MKSPNSSAQERISKPDTIEGLEQSLEDAKTTEDVLILGIQLSMIKTHILAMGIPSKTSRKDLIQAIASGTAFGAFANIEEIASTLPEKVRQKAKREMIAHYLEVQAFILDQLTEADNSQHQEAPKTLQ